MTTPDPRTVLRDRIATIAQREYENSITTAGTVAFRDHLGDRIAVEVMRWVVDAALTDAVAAGRRQAAENLFDTLRAAGVYAVRTADGRVYQLSDVAFAVPSAEGSTE